jgi:uncharacterized protein
MNTSISKSFSVDQNIEIVWNTLTSPEQIVGCVPGASLTEKVDEDNYKGEVELKFGPVKAAYDGLVTFTERDKNAYKMVLKGSGTDVKGKGGADMLMEGVLTSSGDNCTDVAVTMDIEVSGMLAQFGSRLINDVSNHVFDQFVGNFKALLAGQEVDNSLSAGSVVGSMIKGLFGGKKA